MRPSEVRERIIEQHKDIREMLIDLERMCDRVIDGKGYLGAALAEYARALHTKLLEHLELEDSILVPALRDADAWGEVRADSLLEHHRTQREQLSAALLTTTDAPAGPDFAKQVLALIADLRDDMQHEEGDILSRDILRDDVVGVDVEAG